MTNLTPLPERGVIAVEGDDRVAFLQGLVSNDIDAVGPGHAVWAALLTAQGKWLADFFVFADADALLLDCERAQIPMLIQRLSRYRLRMKATLRAVPELLVHVAWPDVAWPDVAGLMSRPDARGLPGHAAPRRSPTAGLCVAHPAAAPLRQRHAGGLGPLPADSRPAGWLEGLEADRSVLLEAGFDELPACRGRRAATWARN